MIEKDERRPVEADGALHSFTAQATVAQCSDAPHTARNVTNAGATAGSVNGDGIVTSVHPSSGGDEDGRSKACFYTPREIALRTPAIPDWLVEPWLVPGAITLVAGKPKAGKTTFVFAMIKSVLNGERFLDKETRRTPVVYLTEQSLASVRPALDRAGLMHEDETDLHVLSYPECTGLRWTEFVSEAIAECAKHGAKLLVIDTFAEFAQLNGDRENSSGDVLAALRPLREAQQAGIAVMLIHHERKGSGDSTDTVRGSTALSGGVDVVVQLQGRPGNCPKTHRVVSSISRFVDGQPDLVIDLTEGVYTALGSTHDVSAAALRTELAAILADVDEAAALTCEDICAQLETPPSRSKLQNVLKAGAAAGLWARRKEGKSYLYFAAPGLSETTASIHSDAPYEMDGEVVGGELNDE